LPVAHALAKIDICLLQDTLCTAGLQTTAAARILEGYMPSHDATSVALLKAAGGIIVGKCNCDAFAMGSTNESSDYKVRSCPAEQLV
jgi:aspartyl-tRNA(Asn)/glutamyl-tRNA(Gln) amidotransferase subunit A